MFTYRKQLKSSPFQLMPQMCPRSRPQQAAHIGLHLTRRYRSFDFVINVRSAPEIRDTELWNVRAQAENELPATSNGDYGFVSTPLLAVDPHFRCVNCFVDFNEYISRFSS